MRSKIITLTINPALDVNTTTVGDYPKNPQLAEIASSDAAYVHQSRI